MPMNENKYEEPGISRHVLEMITVANEYCLFFEKAENYTREDIFLFFQKIAPMIYLKGSLLPETDVADDTTPEKFVTEEEWEQIFRVLRKHFNKMDVYYIHDHLFDSKQASLADNMADIYQDMKDFLRLYQKNTSPARQSAVALLRDLYKWHWGPALLSALGAVHNILFKDQVDPGLFDNDHDWSY